MRLLEWFRRQDSTSTYAEQYQRARENYLAQLSDDDRADLIAAETERHEALSSLGVVSVHSCRRSGAFATAEEIRRDTESIVASVRRSQA